MGSFDDGTEAAASCDVLLLAAFAPELAPLGPALSGTNAMTGRIGDVSVVARECGIGLPSAAARAALHIRETRPRAVVLLGTCGAYPVPQSNPENAARLAIGDLVVSRQIFLVDPSALAGHTQFPPVMGAPIASALPIREAFVVAGASPADMATTLAITVDDDVAARIARMTRAHVEHLEAYGVAVACAACAVPFAAVLGVANAVGSRGRQEWQRHHLRASARAAHAALRWIEQGALASALAGDRAGFAEAGARSSREE